MKTIGAKLSDDVYEECEWVRDLLGFESRSGYVKTALRFFNAWVRNASESVKTSLTSSEHPGKKLVEPNAQVRTEGSESLSSTDKASFRPESAHQSLVDEKEVEGGEQGDC